MKRLISLLSILVLLLAFNSQTYAQSNVEASVEVVKALSFNNPDQLKFGQILTGQTNDATVDPNGTNSNVGGTAQAGKIAVTGSDTASVTIDFSTVSNLNDGNSHNIGFTPDYDGNTADNMGAASDLTEGSVNTVTLSNTGKYYIYYGGVLNGSDISSRSAGYYSASISTTVSYE